MKRMDWFAAVQTDWFMADLAIKIFLSHWMLTFPMSAVAFWIGIKKLSDLTVWFLLLAGLVYFWFLPHVPGAAEGPSALIYIVLPLFVPFYILVPYLIGVVVRRARPGKSANA